MKTRWIGFGAGLAISLGDYLLFRATGIDVVIAGRDITALTMLFFGLSFGAFGYALGRVIELRRTESAQARQIAEQLATIQAQHARSLELEKLASLGRMAAGVAHEVRNPLGVIRSSASLIAEDVESEDGRKACAFIVEEVDRLDGFVREVLALSRPLSPERAAIDGRSLVERVQARSEGALTVHGDGVLHGDEDLLLQVVLGLVTNAQQMGASQVSVHLGPNRVEVEDDGPGVDAEHRDHIFEPFFTTRAEGTGLGLAMAARIVQAHEGELSLLQSERTRFRIALPERP